MKMRVEMKNRSRHNRTILRHGYKYTRYKICLSMMKPVGIYLLKVNNKNTRARCEICFTPCYSVSVVNFEHVIAGWVVTCNKQRLSNI